MRIIIVGGGKVGLELAGQLRREAHDIVIVDRSADALARAEDQLDVMPLRGNGASGETLKEAGIARCDLLIASTSSDELNMLACLTGKKLGAKHSAARIRDPDYARDISMIKRELGINLVINPEQATAAEISRLLRFSGAMGVEHFSKGRIELIRIPAPPELCGLTLAQIPRRKEMLFCVCDRDGEAFIPHGETAFCEGDMIYAAGTPDGVLAFCRDHRIETGKARDLMILGGGKIGRYLASAMIKMGVSTRIIERDERTCIELSEDIPDAVIIHGDGTEQNLLESENISGQDAFCALTGRDEDNLITALYAKHRGVKKITAKATRQNYASLTREMGLTSVVSPKAITASSMVRFVRGLSGGADSKLDAMYRIAGGAVDILEFSVGRDFPYNGKKLKDLPRRHKLLVCAIIRDSKAIIPDGETAITAGDSVIIAAKDAQIKALEHAF